MKRFGIILSIVVVIVAGFIFVNKSYYFYPSLPVDNLSARYVIGKLENSDTNIVQFAEEDDYTWYITENGKNGDDSSSDENIKELIASNGWEFKEKEGSGLFFEKDDKELITTTQMWTDRYVIVQVQNKFKEL